MKNNTQKTIGRVIWESIDLTSLLYIGSAAQFYNHKDVEWLYYTGGFLDDPVIRGIHTTQWVRRYMLAKGQTNQDLVANSIRTIHTHIERSRHQTIPKDAYRDVLFMSFDMGIRAYEMVIGRLTEKQKLEYFHEIIAFGKGMHIEDLPDTYEKYLQLQLESLQTHYYRSNYSNELFDALENALGPFRFLIAKNIMVRLAPPQIKLLLPYKENVWFPLLLRCYRCLRSQPITKLVFSILVPRRYHAAFFEGYE